MLNLKNFATIVTQAHGVRPGSDPVSYTHLTLPTT